MAKEKENESLFKKLTDLFRSGPTVRRKVKAFQNKAPGSPSSLDIFRKAHSDVYNSTISAYGSYDRMARYSDFSEMDSTPEICSALDIYAEETVSPDVDGNVIHIYSENKKIKQILDNLFYDVLNVEFNLVMWVRNLCKYGDFFLFNDISPDYGVINVFPIPIAEIEREEGFDPTDPGSVRFRWITQGNRILENWQITHFRLLGNDAFLPYGSSVLEGARRIWRQLILIEDAMLVYRVIRAPERRVFYIDVGNIPPENVGDYLQQAQTALKRNAVVDKTTGKVDLRYNPLSVDEDYFLPVRGGDTGTKIDTLAGGQNTSAIEDVEYIQKKLFSALKVPKAYLGYDEEIGAKATLAQEDIRFSRTIQRIQKTIVSELNKIAMIHLYSHGYTSEDLLDFELKLSNPSSIAQQQKLELIRTKFEIAGAVPEGLVDKEWIRKNIMEFNDDEIKRIEKGKIRDKIADIKLESITVEEQAPGGAPGGASGGGDMFGGGGAPPPGGGGGGGLGDLFGGGGGEEAPGGEGGGGGMEDLFAGDMKLGNILGEEDEEDEDDLLYDDETFNEIEKNRSYKIKPSREVKSKKTKSYRSHGNSYDDSRANLLGGERGILGGTNIKPPSAKDLLNQGEAKGYNDYQMKKIFDSLERHLGGPKVNQKAVLKENQDLEIIYIDQDDEE
jgi:hypothetical protein